MYQDITAQSYIVGSINITNEFKQESFSYKTESITFYNDNTDTYSFIKNDLPKVPTFNGIQKQYEVKMNEFVLYDAIVTAGGIVKRINIDFYDIENNLIKSVYFDLSIRFLSNKTELSITTIGAENAQFIEQWILDNWLRIQVNEITKGEK
jgi:butyrate kinase